MATAPPPDLSLPEATAARLARLLRPGPGTPPPPGPGVRPVHVLYGGAHLFSAGSLAKLAKRAADAMTEWGDDDDQFGETIGLAEPALAGEVAARVRAKLSKRPIEAICIDFEDGFGPRPDAEEDAEALRTASELAVLGELALLAPGAPAIGVRIKALGGPTLERAVRTLDLFLTRLARSGGGVPPGFTVTLPKVARKKEVAALGDLLSTLEARLALGAPIPIELMVETPSALVDPDGRIAIRGLVDAGAGRVVAVHLGAYDLTAELGVTAADQRLDHPFCDLARALLKLGSPVPVADGATTFLPIGAPGASAAERRRAVHAGWALHARNVTRALEVGVWQGWDLHPAQLPARYGALFAHFIGRRQALAERLARFVERWALASRVGQVFDDAATGHGLLGFFRRGLVCGALDDADLRPTGLTRTEIEGGSFETIVSARRD